MTDRHAAYIVTLAEEGVLNAIRMVQGVLSVQPVVGNYEVHVAEERARWKLQEQLRDVLWGDK